MKNTRLETTEDDAKESLNRVAGEYDRGFSSSEQSYQSEDHYAAGTFAREKAATKSGRDLSY